MLVYKVAYVTVATYYVNLANYGGKAETDIFSIYGCTKASKTLVANDHSNAANTNRELPIALPVDSTPTGCKLT